MEGIVTGSDRNHAPAIAFSSHAATSATNTERVSMRTTGTTAHHSRETILHRIVHIRERRQRLAQLRAQRLFVRQHLLRKPE
jgi:hypothetical protein